MLNINLLEIRVENMLCLHLEILFGYICDVEHPSIIPMDSTSTHPTPRGPMTRARARAIQSEVNSLLVELPFDPLETWLLPQTEMLCVLRYQESNQGEVTTQDEHREHVDDLPSPERPEQPPNHRPGGTTG